MKSNLHEMFDRWPGLGETIQPTPADLADQFLNEAGLGSEGTTRLIFWHGDFYVYERTHYERISKGSVSSQIVSWMQNKGPLRKYAKTGTLAHVLLNVEAQTLLSDKTRVSSWLNGYAPISSNFISMSNGVFGIDDYLAGHLSPLVPHSPNFLSTGCLPYEFDPKAQCPLWTAYLTKMQPDPDIRSLLQEWFGYNLIFDTTQQKFLLLKGEGADGKTVFCIVLRTILGDSNVSAVPLEAFSATRTFPLAATVGKRANIVEEMNDIDKAAEGELKKFVSGGLMTIERKFRDPFETCATARLTYATNQLPKFSDRSDGIWRRALLVPWAIQIKNESEQDKRLVMPRFAPN